MNPTRMPTQEEAHLFLQELRSACIVIGKKHESGMQMFGEVRSEEHQSGITRVEITMRFVMTQRSKNEVV